MSLRTFVASAALVCAPVFALAAPFAWMPGSSQDNPETGNKMAIVDLESMSVVGSWTFIPGNEGADPLVTGFSPDGAYAYVLVGGDADDDITGRLWVFDTADAIAALQSAGTPVPIQIIEYPQDPGSNNTIEPVAVVSSPDGARVYVTEADREKLYCYNVQGDGTLSEFAVLDTGPSPGPLFISSDSSTGFFVNAESFKANRVSLGGSPTITETETFAPTQFDPLSQPLTTGAFVYPQGSDFTVVPPPGGAPDLDTFYIFTGYFGFQVYVDLPFIGGPFTILGKYDVWAWPASSTSPSFFTSNEAGNDEIAFPPLVNIVERPDDTRVGTITGARILRPDGGLELTVPPAAAGGGDSNHFMTYGMSDPGTNKLFFGSIALPVVSSTSVNLDNLVYAPRVPNSDIYEHQITGRTITLTRVGNIARNSAFPLGFANGKVIFAGNDVISSPGINPGLANLPRTTLLIPVDPQTSTLGTPLDIGLVAGSAAIQPIPSTQMPPTLDEVADALLGSTSPEGRFDVNTDGVMDSADLVATLIP